MCAGPWKATQSTRAARSEEENGGGCSYLEFLSYRARRTGCILAVCNASAPLQWQQTVLSRAWPRLAALRPPRLGSSCSKSPLIRYKPAASYEVDYVSQTEIAVVSTCYCVLQSSSLHLAQLAR